MRVDTVEKPYMCTHCDKPLSFTSTLKCIYAYTLVKNHTNVASVIRYSPLIKILKVICGPTLEKKPYHCTQCGKAFS